MNGATVPSPPAARRDPKTEVVHGRTLVDPFAWLREKESPAVRAHLEAENSYTAAVMRPLEPLVARLYDEILSHVQEDDLSVPYREGDFFYVTRTEKGKQYPIKTRRRLSPDAPDDLVLDLNELAKGLPFLALGSYEVSDDGTRLLYSLDTTGFRQYTLLAKDLSTGAAFPFRAEKTTSAAWAADGRTLFFTVEDDANRPYRLYRAHVDGGEPVLVYEEKDERFGLEVGRTRSGAFVVLAAGSHTASEWRILPADRPEDELRLVAPRRDEHEYDLDHRAGFLYIRTNDRGRNFRLVTTPVESPGEASWKELIPHRPDVLLEGVDLFERYLVAFEREGGLPRLVVHDLDAAAARKIEFPEPVYEVSPGENRVFSATSYRYRYESLVTPPSIFDFDMVTGVSTLRKRTPVPGGFDSDRYASERLWATAKDGARIPISIVHRKDVARDGRAPMLLLGYGAYGYSLPDSFVTSRLPLLDRGVVFGIAHIRGGGEMGKHWHDAGRMEKKTNTFDDFIAAAEALVEAKVTSHAKLAIEGRSAGGLLIGAVLNRRPDLAAAAMLTVPFVDVVNTMRDATLPLTIGEYEEWGNPAIPQQFAWLEAYCPYTNLASRPYPALLVQTSFFDSQVMYWEPAKYVAKIRSLTSSGQPVLLKTNLAAGHGGASGRYDHLREVAFEHAFVLWRLGVQGGG
ncbi:MAG TPA: S9 family peptidase [Thermoanaerobaculia bacterium]|nr:S9 family peptidase [Thermoanaerobaculia bacterium]